jgi:hypothetical protein
VQNIGFLHLASMPFFFIGVYQIIRRKVQWGYFVLGWVLLTPIILAPFISESPNIHRFLLAILPLLMIVGFGIQRYFELIKKRTKLLKLSIVVVPLLFVTSLLYFINQLFVHQPVHRPWYRSYPFQELMADLKRYEPKYDKIVVTTTLGNSYMFYLFYNKYDPKKYQDSGSKGNNDTSTLDKYEFSGSDCPLKPEVKVLFVINGMNCIKPTEGYKLVKIINWGDKTPAFKLYEYTP